MLDVQTIERKALGVLNRAGIAGPPPVDLGKIARYLGIRIDYRDLGSECSGVLVRNSSGGGVIGVNWADHTNRQRFTVAHEIGHYVLHEGGAFVDRHYRLNVSTDSGSGSRQEETEANQFAAALLMPKKWVSRTFRDYDYDLSLDDNELRDLAARFRVSAQAMAIRLSVVTGTGSSA